ncbi:MAG TPA: hypothetical protein VGM62_17235 [Chthoniobacterales bacterium]
MACFADLFRLPLEDGTVWKQVNESDNFEGKLTDHPPVMVTHSLPVTKCM